MNAKSKKLITVFFIFAAFVCSAVLVYGIVLTVTFFKPPKPIIQMLHSPTSEQEKRIAQVAGIDAEYKIVYAEKWKSREPALIIWLSGDGDVEKGSLHVNDFKKTEKIRKYDPLSRTFVTGDYYENDTKITMFAYKNYSGNFIKYQIIFNSPGELNSVLDIFMGLKEYKAGSLDDYDSWRLQMDGQFKG